MFKPKTPLKDPGSFIKGYEYALFLLSLRQYSQKQLEEKMTQRGYAIKVITDVTTEVKKLKYINDRNMAILMLESFKQYRTYGYYMIKQKMMQKRLPQKQIEQVLSDFTIEDETIIAKRYLEKESKTNRKNLDPKLFKQKLAQKLKARGFRSDIIKGLL